MMGGDEESFMFGVCLKVDFVSLRSSLYVTL